VSNNSIFSSARWTIATSIVRKLFTFGLFYFIARILTKDDLGLFREYSLILTLGSIFFAFSLDHLLVVSKEKLESNFRSIFYLTVLGGLVGTIILFLTAPLLGNVYRSITLVALIRMTSALLFLESIRRILSALMQRELRLKALATFQTFNVVFYSVVTLIALFIKPSVWVLVLGFYSGNVLEMILIAFNCRDLIRKYLKKASINNSIPVLIRTNSHFIGFAWTNNILSNISANAPILILGMVFPVAGLGAYYLANQVIIIPVTIVTTALLQVFFPSFSRKDDKQIALHIRQFTDFVLIGIFPLLALYALFCYHYIPLIFGEKWLEASQLALILSFTSAISLLMNPLSGIPYTLHKPDWELYWTIFSSVIKIGAVVYFARFGFVHAIIGFTGASVVSQLIFLFMIGRLLKINQLSYWGSFILKILPTIILALILTLFYSFTKTYSPFIGVLLTMGYYLLVIKFSDYRILVIFGEIVRSRAGNRPQNS
jgi:O-antigen/teichoic acid export membrane protein